MFEWKQPDFSFQYMNHVAERWSARKLVGFPSFDLRNVGIDILPSTTRGWSPYFSLRLFDQAGLPLSEGGRTHIRQTVWPKTRGQDGEGYIKWKKVVETHAIWWRAISRALTQMHEQIALVSSVLQVTVGFQGGIAAFSYHSCKNCSRP